MTAHSLAPILQFVLSERGWSSPARLERMAGHLPAVAAAGLEMPLAQGDRIDLQQRLRIGPELGRLRRWLHALAGPIASEGSAWERLLHACADGLLDDIVEEIWLELDDVKGLQMPPLSVFVRFPAAAACRSGDAVARVLESFRVMSSASQESAVARCIEACGPGARVSHLGLMLGRTGTPLRVIVDGIAWDDITGYLERAAWPGPTIAAQEFADRLFVHADRMRLALTIGDVLAADLGFECFVGEAWSADPRWRCFLDLLVSMKLCAPSQRDRFLAWPAAITPVSAGNAWPESLIVDALARGGREIGALDCRVSHVKVSFASPGPSTAKGYFGFVEVWENASSASAAPTQPARRVVTPGTSEAIGAALDFLLAARNPAGWWLDYDGFGEGPSDEWVTAYVGHALHDSGGAAAEKAAARAWDLLARRSRTGWGWNFVQPADADSTMWALRLGAVLGALRGRQWHEGIAFLRAHLQPDGGVATYLPEHYRAWSEEAEINTDWYQAHACVTAAAADFAPLGAGPLAYLRRTQRPDGSWPNYWWRHPFYSAAHAAESLAGTGVPADAAAVLRTVEWAASQIDDIGDRPFELALALRVFLLAPGAQQDRIAEVAHRLVVTQLSDGSWAASAHLAIPNRRGDIVPALDNRRCFTTATVQRALRQLDQMKART